MLTRLYQGFYESPTIINKALKKSLRHLQLIPESLFLEYVNYFLIVAPNEEH